MFDLQTWLEYLKLAISHGAAESQAAAANVARLLRFLSPGLAAKLAPLMGDAKAFLSQVIAILESALRELEPPRVGSLVPDGRSFAALQFAVQEDLKQLPAEHAPLVAAASDPAAVTPGDIMLILDVIKMIGGLIKKRKAA